MSEIIVITHLGGGTLQGQMQFPQERVSIGRGGSNDIAFDPQRDTVVSGRHCELWIHEGRLCVRDLGSSNGTFVNGVRVDGSQYVGEQDRITLGSQGPTLTAALHGVGVPGGTPPPPPPPPPPVVDETHGAPPPPLSGFANEPPPSASGKSRSRWGTRSRSRGNSGRSRGIGMQTLQNIVLNATQKERKRTRRLLLLLTLFLVGGGGGAAWYFWPDPKPPQVTNVTNVTKETTVIQKEPAEAVFPRIIKQVQPSIYAVLKKSKVGKTEVDTKGGGTAWVIAPGILATNVHVAEPFLSLKKEKGERLIARSATDPPHDLHIEKVTLHPGFHGFSKMRKRYRPFDKAGYKFLKLPPSCDVALMTVAAEDRSKMGPPLELATPEELAALTPGEPLGFVGFPVEGMISGTFERPRPDSATGTLSKLTDFFLERNSPDRELFVHYSIRIEGGGSGSPIFNMKGKVVAVHNAGNFKFVGGERISQGTTTLGQRVDLVRELLDGTVTVAHKRREDAWRATFLQKWKSGHGDPLLGYLANIEIPKAFGRKDRFKLQTKGRHDRFRNAFDSRRFTLSLRKTGPWVVLAIADADTPVALNMSGDASSKSNSTISWAGNRQGLKGKTINVTLRPSSDLRGSAGFTLYLLQP